MTGEPFFWVTEPFGQFHQWLAHGPTAGLAVLGTLDGDLRLTHSHRLEAVRAHHFEQAGDHDAARES
jgi:predicted RNA polymerase sigma factor